MKLYFVRHGQAGRTAASDELRQLDEVGIQEATRVGLALAQMGIKPAQIFSSPRLRASETARLIGAALGIEPTINDACNFDFNAQSALELAEPFAHEEELMFVGHNPSMSEVVTALSGARVELTTAAVACVSRVHPPLSSSAILKWLLTPRMIDAMLPEDEQ
jgi:phosphohistidine phosphatase